MVMSIMAGESSGERSALSAALGHVGVRRLQCKPFWVLQRETVSSTDPPVVGVLMGSSSDWETLQHATAILAEFGVPHECRVVSAHRMPDDMFAYAEAAAGRGLKALIAGAGGAAHLPGMLAAKTVVPVLGVPVPSRHLQGVDSLHSIVQMPKGVPVATFAIGVAGAANAALFAVAMLANQDAVLRDRLQRYRAAQTAAARAMTQELK
jgi:5-(carboxyamino)imidazole ribonucleotide mutase